MYSDPYLLFESMGKIPSYTLTLLFSNRKKLTLGKKKEFFTYINLHTYDFTSIFSFLIYGLLCFETIVTKI